MNNQVIAGIAVLALIVGGVAVLRPATVERVVEQVVGAVSGPDRSFDCESRNGVTQCFARKSLSVGTTTSCAIKAPRTGSSTLIIGSASVVGGTNDITTAVTFTKGLTMQASTTALSGTFVSTADASGSFIASTTNPEQTRQFGPADWLQVNFAGGVGTASTSGSCSATWELI